MDDEKLEHRPTVGPADYVRMLAERWWVIVLVVVVFVGASLAVSFTSDPMYRCSARLLYMKNNLDQVVFGSQVTSGLEQRAVQTGAMLVKVVPVAEAVIRNLGLSYTPQGLLGKVSVSADTAANVIHVQVVSGDPKEGADIANAIADEFILSRQTADRATVAAARELVKQQIDSLTADDLETQYGMMLREKFENLRIVESMQNGGFTVVERAIPATAPFSPLTRRNALLAFGIGIILGIALVLLLNLLDKRVKDEPSLEREMGVPVLATVPTVGGRWGGRNGDHVEGAVGFADHPALLESFRTLRSNLQYFSVDRDRHVWLITSGLPQQGKTTTTVNLGLSLALSGKRVIMLEADLRRPKLHHYIGMDQGPGLSNVLAGTRRLDEALRLVKADSFFPSSSRRGEGDERRGLLQRNFYVLNAGPLPPNPAELLGSDRMARVIEELRSMTDYLLIDTPPVLLVSDALALAPSADGVILTALLGQSTRDEVQQVRSIFQRAGVRIVGVVAGGGKKGAGYYRKRGYGYGYGYGYDYYADADGYESEPLTADATPKPVSQR